MKTISTLALVFFVSLSMIAKISKTEKEALLKLYSTTNGANWINKWDLKQDETSWYGKKLKTIKWLKSTFLIITWLVKFLLQ